MAYVYGGVGALNLVVNSLSEGVEFDASFKKALPLLSTGYVSEHQLAPSKTILKAAALTYVAGTLLQLLNFWRWIAVLRR